MSGVFFIYLTCFFVSLRQGLLMNSEFTGLARLVSQEGPGISYSTRISYWITDAYPCAPYFIYMVIAVLGSSYLCGKHFIC